MRIIVFLFLISVSGFSQNSLLNESKYWVMRDRLVNDFMVPGQCNGCGIVMKSRGHRGQSEWPDGSGNWVEGGLDISDEGFELGAYLLVLASEWRLLYQSGLDRTKNELELYLALKTIDRLDYSAEYYWSQFGHWYDHPENPYGSTNGFLIRDDMFENFIAKEPNDYENAYKHYLYLNQGADGRTGKYQKQNILNSNDSGDYILSLEEFNDMKMYYNAKHDDDNHIRTGSFSAASEGLRDSEYPQTSQYSLLPKCNNCTGPREFSQDNYIGLLMGLVATYKLVENWVTHDNMHIAQYSSDIIDRIIHQIKNNDFMIQDNWVIDNPVTGKCVKGINWTKYLTSLLSNYCNSGGAQAGLYSGQFAKIHNQYTNTSNINGQIISWVPNGNDKFINSSILLTLTNSQNNSNEKAVSWVENNDYRNEFMYLDLLFLVLHEGYPLQYSSGNQHDMTERGYTYYNSLLDNMPCFGEEYYNSDNILDKNYLPEMASHNLYKLLRGEKYKKDLNDNTFYPRMENNVIITHDVPHGGAGIEHHIDPICDETINALYKINSRAHISYYEGHEDIGNIHYGPPCYANTTYKAGNSIKLLPGFKTDLGTHFLAKIEDFGQCKIIEGQYNFWEFPDIGNDYETPFIISEIYNYKKQLPINEKDYSSNSSFDYKISPNPTKDKLKISFDYNDNYSITIYKTTSEIIYKKKLYCNEVLIDLTNNTSGIYILEIINLKGEISNEKIILQK